MGPVSPPPPLLFGSGLIYVKTCVCTFSLLFRAFCAFLMKKEEKRVKESWKCHLKDGQNSQLWTICPIPAPYTMTHAINEMHCSHVIKTKLSHQTATAKATATASVVYFDQLSGACSTRKLVETCFSTFFVHFRPFLVISWLKSTKNEQKKT